MIYTLQIFNYKLKPKTSPHKYTFVRQSTVRTYRQLQLQQWGAGNVYLLVLSSWKVNITKNPIAFMGL